ncbi:MAG: T9SS type A sorting domain-containing protein, partial [Candidatus Marinimicrobia bacterium]|nr:T9SS type A sorting domain-containing protein [Candidatus Neomarinimicrobiota bacterium]
GNPNQTMGMALYSPDVEVKNNIIINCERGITSTFLPTNCEDNPFVLSDGFNNIWGNELNYCNIYPSETDVSVDPLLNSNHQLTENSPCIDAGDPDSPLDPDGTRLDIGAFYFDKVPNAPTGFTILGDVGDHPELTWDEHEESDVNEFLIYRSLNYGAFLLTATVSQTNWVDTEVTINNEKKFSNRACYYIKAVDAIMQESPSTTPQCESVDIGLKKQAFTLIPKVYEWSSAHPNPFNPTTTIQYGLPVSSHITFTIHNMVGQLIRTLQLREIPAGVHSIQWNSLNDAGEKVPSGMYIVQMKAISTNAKKHFTNAQKVVLLK